MDDSARKVIDACTDLPTIPGVAIEVLRLSRDDDVDLRQIAEVIQNDVALSGRILKVVNSAFYGLPRKIGTISQGVVILGLASVKTLTLGFSLASSINHKTASNSSDMLNAYWRRSLYLAVAARTFAEKKTPILREEAFTAGLLADVGTLAMSQAFGAGYADMAIAADRDHDGAAKRERETFSTDHAVVGGGMGEAWQLPELLTLPITCHHAPDRCGDVDQMVRDLVRVVHTADLCAEVFCGTKSKTAVDRLEDAAEKNLDLDRKTFRGLLENLHRDAEEMGRLLDVQLDDQLSYGQIIRQASEELTRLTLETQRQAQQTTARVQELEASNRELAANANTDPLTGAYNRRFLEGFLDREVARAQRFKRPLSVLFVDLDHFKEVNDTYGHAAGDEILRQVVQLLKAGTRDVDCLCRYGGEEFVMILSETEVLGACQLAEKVRRLVAAWKFEAAGIDDEIRMTVSIGVSSLKPGRPVNKDLLLQMADQSVYAAKAEGRNCVCALRKRVSPERSEQPDLRHAETESV